MNKQDINYHLFTKNSMLPMQSIKNISVRNKIETQSTANAYIRRKRLICMSDYNLKSGCT